MARNRIFGVCSSFLLFLILDWHSASPAPPERPVAKKAGGPGQVVTDQTVTELEREALKCRTANDALDLYLEFIARVKLNERQTKVVTERQAIWRNRVEKKLVRLGGDWVTRDAARATAKLADDLIQQAFEQIKAGEYKKAKELFEKASKKDPTGVRADYYLGMLNSPNFWNYAFGAEQYFERAHRRDAENVAIANNLALSRVKMGQFSDAIDLWADALRIAPEVPEVTQNLGRFSKEAGAKRLQVSELLGKRAKRLYDKALAEKKGPVFNEKSGWLYSPLALSIDERERTAIAVDKPGEPAPDGKPAPLPRRALSGFGSGFVINPGYVISNRHVAQAGTTFGVYQPGEAAQEHSATIIAVADELDLALFRCEPLPAPAVALNAKTPRRTSEILVLGFPFGEALGSSIKAVRGTVFGFDDEVKRKIMMYEANTNPGNSGGPICDNTGRVVAVHFAGLNLAAVERGSGKLGMGIPIEAALPFITKTLPDLTTDEAADKLDWPDVDARVSKSVVLIKIYSDTLPMVDKPPTSKSTNIFEDRTCAACKGRSKVLCPFKGCYRGSTAAFEASYSISGVGAGAQVLRWETPVSRTCPGCRGAGVVDCPHCQDGSDPNLK